MLIALNAGHCLNTSGRRVMKQYDQNETQEWVLNKRVVEHLFAILGGYKVDLLRIDDPTGKNSMGLTQRTDKANKAKADVYISVHHNAGINGKTGGGLEVFAYEKASSQSYALQKVIYDEMINAGALKGNRSAPVRNADFAELRQTSMPAVLVECGFMDSPVDAPFIIQDPNSKKFAQGIANGLIKQFSLKKKDNNPQPTPTPKPEPVPTPQGNPYKEPTSNIANGSKGDSVRWVQWELKNKGYSIGRTGIDGICGRDTVAAIRAFQTDKKLLIDGICGVNTRSTLKGVVPQPVQPTSPLKIGDNVKYQGRLYASSSGGGAGKTVNGTYTVSRILSDKSHGILLNNGLGWVRQSDVKKV